jgi:hypothetical protein
MLSCLETRSFDKDNLDSGPTRAVGFHSIPVTSRGSCEVLLMLQTRVMDQTTTAGISPHSLGLSVVSHDRCFVF